MLARPEHWRTHYPGTATEQHMLRHCSYSDRIRYYWPAPEARESVDALLERLGRAVIPATLISQHLPRLCERVVTSRLKAEPRALLIELVRDVLRTYSHACGNG